MALSTGTELRVLVALRRRTARSVAQTAGISEFELSRIVNDRKVPDPATLARIRDAIFTDEPEPERAA